MTEKIWEWPEVPSKFEGHAVYRFGCDCSEVHFVQLEWDDQDPEWRFLTISDTWDPQLASFRGRIKAAWGFLRGKPHYLSEVLLDDVAVQALRKVLDKHTQ